MDSYILLNGKCGCNVDYIEIRDISQAIKTHYHFSSSEFWMWKMFQFGFAYGKRAERARKKQCDIAIRKEQQ